MCNGSYHAVYAAKLETGVADVQPMIKYFLGFLDKCNKVDLVEILNVF